MARAADRGSGDVYVSSDMPYMVMATGSGCIGVSVRMKLPASSVEYDAGRHEELRFTRMAGEPKIMTAKFQACPASAGERALTFSSDGVCSTMAVRGSCETAGCETEN